MVDQDHTVDVIYRDFAKVFDSVRHRFRLVNMKYFDLHDVVVRWIEAYLGGSREYTSMENSREPFQCAVLFRKAP